MNLEEKKYLKRKNKAFSSGKKDQMAAACNQLADFYNEIGDHRSALNEYSLAMDFYNRLGNKLFVAIAHRMIGEMHLYLNKFEEAKTHINDYFQMVQKLGNAVEEQRALVTLGRAHLLHGQWLNDKSANEALNQLKKAEKYFSRGMSLITKLTGKISKLEQFDMEARCCLNIGIVKEHMGDLNESVSFIKKAIQISKTNDIYELLHMSYTSISLLYYTKMDDCKNALRYSNLAFEVTKHLPQRITKMSETLFHKSEILIKVGDFASARQTLAKAYRLNTTETEDRINITKSLKIVVKMCQILDDLVTVDATDYATRKILFEKLGDGCCHIGNFNKAIEYYKKNLEYALLNNDIGKDLIPIYVSLYQTYKDNKQYSQALEYLWKEYELNKDVHHEAFFTLCSIADILELQRQSFLDIYNIYEKAKEHALKVLDDDKRYKLEKIIYNNIIKLCTKHDMSTLLDKTIQEAESKGIEHCLQNSEERSDTDSDNTELSENNMEEWENVLLDNLTTSENSDFEEEQQRDIYPAKRSNRGTRPLTVKRNNKGETQLHQACISGNIELVRRLIDQGHPVNIRDHAGWLPLHEACNHGHRDIVEVLFERGSLGSINDKGGTSCDGITPLYDACSNGYLDVVELLLERGADVTLKTDFGETCLDGLERWYKTNEILECEQVHYNLLKEKVLKIFSQMGMSTSQCLKNNILSIRQNRKKEKEFSVESDSSSGSSEKSIAEISSKLEFSVYEETKKSSVKRYSSNNNNKEDSSVRSDYKYVMEQLKHPQRQPLTLNEDCSVKNRKNIGYLQEDEVDADDWLIDNIGPERKKRRYYNDPIQSTNLSLTRSSSSQLRFTTQKTTYDGIAKKAPDNQLTRTNLSLKDQKIKRKQQTSLLDNGFCRFRSESPVYTSRDESNFNTENENDIEVLQTFNKEAETTTTSLSQKSWSQNLNLEQISPKHVKTDITSFKVKIMEEMLLVPIDQRKLNDINIRWLAEEAARRYYNLVGLKPVIRLKTVDGFTYEENDPVIVAIEQSVLLGTVLEWQTCAIGQRYEEMCQKLQREIHDNIREKLELSQTTNSIEISGNYLCPLNTEPIFKTLLHQSNIYNLDLGNNFLQNEGCQQLSKCLGTMKQLKILNLSNNYITSEGLDALFSVDGGDKAKEIYALKLEELILSKNPLGNASIRIIENFFKNSITSKTLKKLHISQCNLTRIEVNCVLCLDQLVDFDISFNKIHAELLEVVLQKLNVSHLQNLNINYCFKSESIWGENSRKTFNACSRADQIIINLFQSGNCSDLRSVHLSGCQLTDITMYKMIECLKNASNLELLDISDNIQLSPTTFKFIIDKLTQLRKLKCESCHNIIDEQYLEQLERSVSDIKMPEFLSISLSSNLIDRIRVLWESLWRHKAKIVSCDSNVILYTNDSDISYP